MPFLIGVILKDPEDMDEEELDQFINIVFGSPILISFLQCLLLILFFRYDTPVILLQQGQNGRLSKIMRRIYKNEEEADRRIQALKKEIDNLGGSNKLAAINKVLSDRDKALAELAQSERAGTYPSAHSLAPDTAGSQFDPQLQQEILGKRRLIDKLRTEVLALREENDQLMKQHQQQYV